MSINMLQKDVITYAPQRSVAVQANNYFLRHPIVQLMNVIAGSVCWLGLTAVGGFFIHRIWRACRSRKRWCAAGRLLHRRQISSLAPH